MHFKTYSTGLLLKSCSVISPTTYIGAGDNPAGDNETYDVIYPGRPVNLKKLVCEDNSNVS